MSAYVLVGGFVMVTAAVIAMWEVVDRLVERRIYRRAVSKLPPLTDARWDNLLATVDAARDDFAADVRRDIDELTGGVR